jgi:hypothetical protein
MMNMDTPGRTPVNMAPPTGPMVIMVSVRDTAQENVMNAHGRTRLFLVVLINLKI